MWAAEWMAETWVEEQFRVGDNSTLYVQVEFSSRQLTDRPENRRASGRKIVWPRETS